MKAKQVLYLFAALAGLSAYSYAERPEEKVVAPAALVSQPGSTGTDQIATPVALDVANAQWSDIKDCTYGARADFLSGLKRLEAKVANQLDELKAKRATMEGNTDTKDWDFSMKEMLDAQVYLKSMGLELRKADHELWEQKKEKVGLAWVRTQDAFAKVKASTTR